MHNDSLELMEKSLPKINLGVHSTSILRECEQRRTCFGDPMTDGCSVPRLEEEGQSLWRQRVYVSIQEITVPDPIPWMLDDNSLSDRIYCQRALDEIRARFERSSICSLLRTMLIWILQAFD